MEESPAVVESPPVVDPVKTSEPVREVKMESSETSPSQDDDASTRVSIVLGSVLIHCVTNHRLRESSRCLSRRLAKLRL